MALRLWYPLSKDLNDYGLDNNNLINSNTSVITLNAQGKLGEGAYEDKLTSWAYLTSEKPILLPKTHSMFCWVYPTVLSSTENLDGVFGNHSHSLNANTGLNLRPINTTDYRVTLSTGNGTGRTFNSYYGNTILKANEWHHIGFTYDGNYIRLYADGKLDKEVAYPNMKEVSLPIRIFSWSNNYNSNTYTGAKKINDIRVYDECLSQQQINEISKGLILHYKMEEPLVYPNLKKGAGLSVYNNYAGLSHTFSLTGETFRGAPIYRLTMTPDANTLQYVQTGLYGTGCVVWGCQFKANTAYTYWMYYKCVSHMDTVVGGTASNIGGWYALPSEPVEDGWYKIGQYRGTGTTTDKSDGIFTSFYTPSATAGKPVIIEFAGPHLIQSITSYTEELDYNWDTPLSKERDVSGKKMDATFSYIKPYYRRNSKRYRGSYDFSISSSAYLKVPVLNLVDTTNSWTIAWWSKTAAMAGQMAWGFSDGNRLNLYPNTFFCMNTGDGVNNPFLNNNGTSVYFTQYEDNKWHHYAITGNGSTNNLYIDGKYVGKSKTYKGMTGTQIYISGWNEATSYKWLGSLNDFRLYGTVFTAEEIENLYTTSANIDNKYNITARELVEEGCVDLTNLIYNGKLELENTTGFSGHAGLVYTTAERYNGSKGSLYCPNSYFISNTYVPINDDDTYQLDFDIKFAATTTAYCYLSLYPYDQWQRHIDFGHVNRYSNADTTLAADLVNGATTATLTSGTGWVTATSSNNAYQRYFGVCDYQFANYERCRIYAAFASCVGNTITFNSAWTGGTIPAGTKVSNFYAGSTEFYFRNFAPGAGPTEWTHYTYTVKGSNIRKYTNFARLALIWNSGTDCYITNIEFKNITKLQVCDYQNVNEKGIINNKGDANFVSFNEIGYPIRYIRDFCGTNNMNASAHWVEIQAINNQNKNLALGKTVTSTASSLHKGTPDWVTDGDIEAANWIGCDANDTNPPSVTVDLGQMQDITTVIVRHYYGDGRVYNATKTQVSADGIEWNTIFDSAISGTYAETATGNVINIGLNKQAFVAKYHEIFANNFEEN